MIKINLIRSMDWLDSYSMIGRKRFELGLQAKHNPPDDESIKALRAAICRSKAILHLLEGEKKQ